MIVNTQSNQVERNFYESNRKKEKAILETTFHLLNQKTIREITVDEIAHKADVSKVDTL